MSIQIDITELKDFLVSLIEDVRKKPQAAYNDGIYSILSTILIFLTKAEQKGELDMKELKKEITVKAMTMGDIPDRTRGGVWPDLIKEQVEQLETLTKEWSRGKGKLEDKPALPFGEDQIKYTHLSSLLNKLKDRNEISKDIKLIKRKETTWMVKA